MTLLQTKTQLDTWLTAPWQEFVNIADASDSTKLKGYYYNGKMRFEPISIGSKRLQYEDLGISEYWIVNVQTMQIFAFANDRDGSIRRIRASLVLSGLNLEILEQALQRSRQENQSATTAWLMEQFK